MAALTLALGAFLAVVGAAHFVVPSYFERLVPPWLPRPRALVLASGAVEVALGVGLWTPATRPAAAWAAAGLMAVYVATHVDALARSSRDRAWLLDRPAGAVARVAVNLVYLAWAAAVALHA